MKIKYLKMVFLVLLMFAGDSFKKNLKTLLLMITFIEYEVSEQDLPGAYRYVIGVFIQEFRLSLVTLCFAGVNNV